MTPTSGSSSSLGSTISRTKRFVFTSNRLERIVPVVGEQVGDHDRESSPVALAGEAKHRVGESLGSIMVDGGGLLRRRDRVEPEKKGHQVAATGAGPELLDRHPIAHHRPQSVAGAFGEQADRGHRGQRKFGLGAQRGAEIEARGDVDQD